MTTRQSKPKLATLPLPRELRDHIYGYLLTTTFWVENIWTGDFASSVPLQVWIRPPILDVSMSTHQEAKQALYRNGDFFFDAFLATPPPPFDGIKHLPGIELLQNITLHFDTRTNFWYGHNAKGVAIHTSAVGSVTKLLDHIAKLDYSVPRTRLVVNLIAGREVDEFLGIGDDAGNFKGALSRLTGFKKMEVKIEWNPYCNPYCMPVFPLVQALDKTLAMTLGDSEGDSEAENDERQGRSCLVYYPLNR